MTGKDRAALDRLCGIFEDNYRISELYAAYLERCPDAISADMINALTEGTDISTKEALVAILSQMFGLDFERGPRDRRLIRDYITPSVRLLDAERYRSDPYFKQVKLDDCRDGNIEIKWETYPAFRGAIAGDMEVGDDLTEIPPLGFFAEDFSFPAILEDGNEWMTLTPVDMDTCTEAIAAAKGRVITFGLGLGYFAYMAARKPEVECVTVVELNPKVISLFQKKILPYFENKDKIRIIQGDAVDFAENEMKNGRYDLAFVDTWRDASDGVPMYLKIKETERLHPNTKFLYWIEGFILSRIRSFRYAELAEMMEKGKLPNSYAEVLEHLARITPPEEK